MNWLKWWKTEEARYEARATGRVIPDNIRCVQCGICSYNCPIGIDVREHAWLGEPINDNHCLTCGECVARCPRGVLRFEQSTIFNPNTLNRPGA